jgi:hypothetical protein
MATLESGKNYNAKGKSGEFGAYQYMPGTWKERAQKYLGNANAQPTPENQSFVHYSWVKEQKDAGVPPDQILAMHNSGGREYASKKGVNKFGVAYDVPLYVERGMTELQKEVQRLGGSVQSASPANPVPSPTATTPRPGFLQSLAQGVAKPFLRAGLSLGRIGTGTAALLSGDQNRMQQYNQNVGSPKSFGYLGSVTPLGYGDQGEKLSTVKGLRQTAGVAAELGSYALGGSATGRAVGSLGKGALGQAVKAGVVEGAAAGGLGSFGASLAQTDNSLGTVAKDTAIGTAAGAAIGGAAATIPAVVLGTKRIISPNTEDALIKAIKPAKNNVRFRADVQTAVPEIVRASQTPIENIDQFVKATNTAKKNVWQRYQTILGQNADATIDGGPIADAIESSIDRRFELLNPAGAKRIRNIAKTYKRKLTLEEAEDFLQSANNDLHSYYAKNKVSQKAAARDPEVAHTLREAEALRDALYAKLSTLSGKDAAAIKRLYGALTNVEEEAIGRANVAARQAPFSLAEQLSFASAMGDALKSVLNLNAGDALSGVAKATVGRLMKKANTTDALIKTGMKKAVKPPPLR